MIGWILAVLVLSPFALLGYFLLKRNLIFRSNYVSRILQENRPSFTAELVCIARAVGNQLGWCHDPLAYYILDVDARIFVNVFLVVFKLTGRIPSSAVLASARTVYFDQFIKDSPGLEQLVLLGAGFDARAYRMRRTLGEGVKMFEVDAPATQKAKLEKMKQLARDHPEIFDEVNYEKYLTFVPCDFSSESWVDKLKEHNLDLKNPHTTILLEGVATYLTREAWIATLKMVAGFPPGTRFSMTLAGKALVASRSSGFLRNVVGEDWKNSWDAADDPDEFYGALGFKVLESPTMESIALSHPMLKDVVRPRKTIGYIFSLEVK